MKIELPAAALGSAREFRCRCTLCRCRHKVHRHRCNSWPPSLPGCLHLTRWRTTHGNRRIWRRKLFLGSEGGQRRSAGIHLPRPPAPCRRPVIAVACRPSSAGATVSLARSGPPPRGMRGWSLVSCSRQPAVRAPGDERPRRIGQMPGSSGHECARWSERGFDNSDRPVPAISRSIITWSEIASET